MNATVIPFPEKEAPHQSGSALCLACQHEWVAVAPTGVTCMECPSCHLMKGRFIFHCGRPGNHWHCFCGNSLFFATRDGLYCPNCGLWQVGIS